MPAWPSVEVGERLVPDGQSPVFACCGYLNAAKRIPQLLEAFERVRRRFPDALLVLAGAAAPGLELDAASLGDGVLRLDHQDERELWQLLADCDVNVSLRWPTMGETSGMAIRALSLGKPLVVSDVGWFSELPDSVAVRVPVDEFEVETLAAVLERLAEDDGLRARMGAAASSYARREHDLDRVADLYVAALEELAGGPAVRDPVLRGLAKAADEVGIDRTTRSSPRSLRRPRDRARRLSQRETRLRRCRPPRTARRGAGRRARTSSRARAPGLRATATPAGPGPQQADDRRREGARRDVAVDLDDGVVWKLSRRADRSDDRGNSREPGTGRRPLTTRRSTPLAAGRRPSSARPSP